jgi:hypothetical protein
MGASTFRSPGLAVLDAMIARAEASCERGRADLTRVSGGRRAIINERRARLQIMEVTLARLQAERDRGSP